MIYLDGRNFQINSTSQAVMGSSAKKKKEKKKDFQKVKLKVGKARPKAANSTDTSFKAKAIVLSQQINAEAPSAKVQFLHHVSLLSSRTDSQRKESLAYLASTIPSEFTSRETLPMPTETLIEKAMPLILDNSAGVRSNLVKMLEAIPARETADQIPKMLPYVRAAMTHLSQDIRKTALDVLQDLLNRAGKDLVSCAGGWTKTLECCITLLNWRNLSPGETWTASKTSFRTDTKFIARIMQVMDQLLSTGLLEDQTEEDEPDDVEAHFPLLNFQHHVIPAKSNPYAYLGLFGRPPDDDSRMLDEKEERLTAFNQRFRAGFMQGIDGARKEGGDIGRVAGQLSKTIEEAATKGE